MAHGCLEVMKPFWFHEGSWLEAEVSTALGGGESCRRRKLGNNTDIEPVCSAVWSTRSLTKPLGHFLHCCRLLCEKQASGSLKDAQRSLLFYPFCHLLA